MSELNLESKWYCYCVLAKVNSKSESLHYLNNWMKCFHLIDDFLQDCPTKCLASDQIKEVILKLAKNGFHRTTSKKASTGGILKWNEENNKKICTLYLQEQLEEIIEVEKTGKDYYDWRIEQFPTRNSHISFYRNEVYGFLSDNINIKKAYSEFPDFLFQLSPTSNPNIPADVNNEIQIYISERYLQKKSIEKVDEFVLKIGNVSKAVKIGRAKTSWQKRYVDSKGSNCIRSYVGSNYADRDTLDFSKIGIEDWETIFE